MRTLTTTITFTEKHEQVLKDILTTFYEDPIMTWWLPSREPKRDSELNVLEVKIRDAESNDFPPTVINLDTVFKGIEKILTPDFKIRSDLREQVMQIVFDPENANYDVEGADSIIQAALFGELVYG